MRKALFFLAIILLANSLPCLAQKFQGDGGLNLGNGPRGRGGGRSSSGGGAAAVTRTYHAEENPDLTPQRALQQQDTAILQYMSLGSQLETKKQWVNAEKAFTYVMKVSAIRDGVGSPKMIPTLQHLVKVTAAQGHWVEAIGYEQRLLGFANNATNPNPNAVINATISLANLYAEKSDFENAEQSFKDAYHLISEPSVPPEKKEAVAHAYGKFLRKLCRDDEAQRIDPIAVKKIPTSIDAAQSGGHETKPAVDSTGNSSTSTTSAKPTSATSTTSSDTKSAKPPGSTGTTSGDTTIAKPTSSTSAVPSNTTSSSGTVDPVH